MDNKIIKRLLAVVIGGAALLLQACGSTQSLPPASVQTAKISDIQSYQYLIGPGDALNIFVWRNPEVSGTFTVRPDGKITTSLVEDIQASGKTPTQLAREIETALATYLRDPIVSVIVQNFNGPYAEQVRVIGEAGEPKAVNYQQYMTLLDVMILVGGLTEFADGNDAVLIRNQGGKSVQYSLALDDLIRKGDIAANADVFPGDIIIIPEAWF